MTRVLVNMYLTHALLLSKVPPPMVIHTVPRQLDKGVETVVQEGDTDFSDLTRTYKKTTLGQKSEQKFTLVYILSRLRRVVPRRF